VRKEGTEVQEVKGVKEQRSATLRGRIGVTASEALALSLYLPSAGL
jgi:hypothetical protein